MNQKKFFRLYLPDANDLYTWHFEYEEVKTENEEWRMKKLAVRNKNKENPNSQVTTYNAQFSNPNSQLSILGSLVQIKFRKQTKIALVVDQVPKPNDFATQPILKILERNFFPVNQFALAQTIADENFCSITKVLAGMVPKEFFMNKTEVKRFITYKLNEEIRNENEELRIKNNTFNNSPLSTLISKIRGIKQKALIEYLYENNGSADEKILRQNFSLQVIKSLLEKNLITKNTGTIIPALQLYEKPVETLHATSLTPKFHPLTPEQQVALDQILQGDKPTLLWGITGSGKTEVYKQVIKQVVFHEELRTEKLEMRSEQALFLLPEIALTPQLIEGFTHSFGAENIAIWHSKLSMQQKIQAWRRITSGEAKILIGTRSAALLPLKNPAVIILDEEHEWTYKNEFSPRCWTHDVVEKICQNRRASAASLRPKLIFGSATPRLESFYNVEQKKWQLAQLTERVQKTPMPNFSVVDLREEIKKNNPSSISETLERKISAALKRKKQVVLFLNKRGYSASTMCQFCSHTFECPNCDSKMKAHKRVKNLERRNESDQFSLLNAQLSSQTEKDPVQMHKLVCHMCGHLEWFPDCCPKCQRQNFEFKGWGTQQVEIELKAIFPTARIIRADADTVTKKSDWNRIHKLFKNKEADILLGTQMISKGLDFEDVELVGIILADIGLNLPDFRAEERVFQLITQVAGRAGRREKQGHIVLQTFQPDSKVFDYILRYDTQGFVDWQATERKNYHLPPFCHFAKLTISHPDKTTAFKTAHKIEQELRTKIEAIKKECHPELVSGSIPNNRRATDMSPLINISSAPAFFPRTHGKYHFHIYLKTQQKKLLHELLSPFKQTKNLTIDVSPSSIL